MESCTVSWEEKVSYNRAVILVILTLIPTTWTMYNADLWRQAAGLYFGTALALIVMYFNWEKLRCWGKRKGRKII